ncbi:MAG TPA: hypothetical protein VIM55_02235 [Mucilaginibacter sp.]
MRKFLGFLLLIISGFLILFCIFVTVSTLMKIGDHENGQNAWFRLGYVLGELLIAVIMAIPSYFLIKKGVKLIQS